MSNEHRHWNEYWSSTKNTPICVNPPAEVYGGTNFEPLASIGMSCFVDAIKDDFVEGFKVVDYGCGAGILANFISERLVDFTYFGLEPSTGWGPKRLQTGREYLNDPRVSFGFVESYGEIVQNTSIDSVILISVFTHLTIQDTLEILQNLLQIFKHNSKASIVFSCFTSQESRVSELQTNINSNYYRDSYIQLNDLQHFCNENKLKLTKHMDFVAMGGWNHEIFKITLL